MTMVPDRVEGFERGDDPRNGEVHLTIGEVARLAGVSTRALRYYEETGLVRPSRNRSNFRLYSREALDDAQRIGALRRLGVPPDEISVLLNSGADRGDIDRLERLVSSTEQRLSILRTWLRDLSESVEAVRAKP